MPTLSSLQLPAPKNWQDFEIFCCDLWRAIWKDPNTQRNGRQGQAQHGVDVFGRPNQGSTWAGIQCKGKDNYSDQNLTERELRDEVDKAKGFHRTLAEYTIATTAPRDATVQRIARQLTDQHRQSGSFSVHIWSWEDILESLEFFPDVVAKHYPQFVDKTTLRRLRAKPQSGSPDESAPKIFICYRRKDSAWASQSIYKSLAAHFGEDNVFFDVDMIPAGLDFHGILNQAVENCDLLLAIIGDHWLEARDEAGRRRLDKPDDFVRIEIEAALARGIPVIPVLVGSAEIPQPEHLPPTLKELSRRQAAEVLPGRDLDVHLDRVVADIQKYLLARQASADQKMSLSIPTLVEMLRDRDEEISKSAIKTLGKVGVSTISVLKTLVRDREERVRRSASEALVQIGPAAVPALMELLKDESEGVRVATAGALGQFGSQAKTAVPALTELLMDESEGVRMATARALGQFGSQAKTAVPALAELLRDESEGVQVVAVIALLQIGPAAVPALTKLLKDENRHSRHLAAEALLRIGYKGRTVRSLGFEELRLHGVVGMRIYPGNDRDPGRTVLLFGSASELHHARPHKLVKDKSAETRKAAASALGGIGSKAKMAVPTLTEFLKDKSAETRQAAASILGRIGPEAKTAVPALTELLKDKSAETREAAAWALGEIGSKAKTAVPDLTELLRDRSAETRQAAASALGRIGPEAKTAVPDLTELLRDRSAETRQAAAWTLGRIGSKAERAVLELTELLRDGFGETRQAAAWALGRIGSKAEMAVPDLTELLKDKSAKTREAAAWALGGIGSKAKEAVPDLTELLWDRSAETRQAAAWALGRIDSKAERAVPDLTELLKDKSAKTREAAAWALRNIKMKLSK